MLAPLPLPDKFTTTALPAITFGAGCFSGRYNENGQMDVDGLVRRAFDLGIRAFDTAPYYGDSEALLGSGLRQLFKRGIARDEVFIMTKCGRLGVCEFDYSPESVRRSITRSCRLLGITHLDVVYLHDVEFVPDHQVLAAAAVLFELKDKGIIGHVGISGYPLHVLNFLASQIQRDLRPLDIILSYSHYNIQNTRLVDYIPKFKESGVRAVLNASPLSMGLLTEGTPPEWHPASKALKSRVISAAASLKDESGHSHTLSDLAVGYALKNAIVHDIKSTIIGFCRIEEINEAVRLYWEVTSATQESQCVRNGLEQRVIGILGSTINETWLSPPEKP